MTSSQNTGGSLSKDESLVDVEGIDLLELTGPHDCNLRFLEGKFGGSLVVRGDHILISGGGDRAADVRNVLLDLVQRVRQKQDTDAVTVSYLWDQKIAGEKSPAPGSENFEPLLFASGSRTAVRAKTPGQQKYVEAVRRDDVVFAIGPAGTGKTFLAVVVAMDYLKRKLVDRIILVRPAVEAGEQLGFLPGDLQDKINPYLRPLFDALSDIMGASQISRYIASGVIEASPLAYMRGRTLNNAFVILDEAQNTTVGQMKMFLTRLGF